MDKTDLADLLGSIFGIVAFGLTLLFIAIAF